jgi:hypothetical protein
LLIISRPKPRNNTLMLLIIGFAEDELLHWCNSIPSRRGWGGLTT